MKNCFLLRTSFWLMVFLCAAFPLRGELKLTGAVLYSGNSFVKGNNTNVYLRYSLTNTGGEAVPVQIVLEPLGGAKGAVYTKNVTMFPHSEMRDVMPLFIPDAERYLISLIHDGRRVDKIEFLMRNTIGGNSFKAILVHDVYKEYDNNVFHKNREIHYRVNMDSFRARDLPEHWGFLQEYTLMILQEPDFATMSFPAMQALCDYVKQGGILYVASPQAAVNMDNSMLAELLPAKPLGFSRISGLNFIRSILKQTEQTEQNVNAFGEQIPPKVLDSLQAVPKEGTAAFLEKDGFSLAYVKNYGLGMVVQLTVNPFAVAHYDKKLGNFFWNVLLEYPSLVYDNYLPPRKQSVNQVLQNLQGFKIPPVAFVMKLFLIYVTGGMVLLLVFLKLKKTGIAWLLFCCLGAVMTGVIFYYARHIAGDQPDRTMIAVSAAVQTEQTGNGPLLGVGNLISKNDSRPDVTSPGGTVGYFPQKRKWGDREDMDVGLTSSPLRVLRDGNTLGLPEISLQQYRPRTFCWTSSSDHYGSAVLEKPRLLLGREKAVFVPWRYSGKISRAMLLLPGEIRSLSVEGDMIADRGTSDIENDLVLLQARKYLRSLNYQTPALAILQIRGGESLQELRIREKDQDFAKYDYHFELIPLDIRLEDPAAGKIWHGRDMIRSEVPYKFDTRQFYQKGEWREVMYNLSDYTDIVMAFSFLPGLQIAVPEKIRVYLDIVNPSGLFQFQPVLLDCSGGEIAAAEKNDRYFEFSGENLSRVLDPLTGSFLVRIKVTSPKETGEGMIQRQIHWKILQFRAAVFGTLK